MVPFYERQESAFKTKAFGIGSLVAEVDYNPIGCHAFPARRPDPTVLAADEFSAVEELVGLLRHQPRLLSLHEGRMVQLRERKC